MFSHSLCGLYLYGEDDRSVAIPFVGRLRVKSFVGLSHESGLQDVSTAAILTKQSVIQIHPLPSSLEIQRN